MQEKKKTHDKQNIKNLNEVTSNFSNSAVQSHMEVSGKRKN